MSIAAVSAIVASNPPAILRVENQRALWFGDSIGPAMAQPAWADFIRQAREPGAVPVIYGVYGDSLGHRVGTWEYQGDGTVSAVIALSAVGFSPSGDEAVVFMDYRCGTHCGAAAIGTFRRRGEGWVLWKSDTISRH